MSPLQNLVVFLTAVVFGLGIEITFSKLLTKHLVVHFKFSRYTFLLSLPLVIIAIMSYLVSFKLWYFFGIFAIIGTLLEYYIGYAYKSIVGQNLWTYKKYSVGGHTSLLSIPLWGTCGVLMYFLVAAFN